MSAEQLSLFDDAGPPVQSLEELVARARAYVAFVLRRRVCVSCCAEEGLVFLHRPSFPTVVDRRPHRWNVPIARLVQVGSSTGRLAEEIAKCEPVCRRCLLKRARPQMLRTGARAPVGVVAKRGSTTGGSETRSMRRAAKASRISNDRKRDA
jgi:hypothetical protein